MNNKNSSLPCDNEPDKLLQKANKVDTSAIKNAYNKATGTKVYNEGTNFEELSNELNSPTDSHNLPTVIDLPAVQNTADTILDPALVESITTKVQKKATKILELKNENNTVPNKITTLVSEAGISVTPEKLQTLYTQALAMVQEQAFPQSIQAVLNSKKPKLLELRAMVDEKYKATKYLRDPQAILSKIQFTISDETKQLRYFLLNTLLLQATISKVTELCETHLDAKPYNDRQQQDLEEVIKRENEEKEKQAKHAEPISTLQSTLREFSKDNPKWDRTLALLKVAESVTTNAINEAITKAQTIPLPKDVKKSKVHALKVLSDPDTELKEVFNFKLGGPHKLVYNLVYWKRVYDEAVKQEQQERKEQELKDNFVALEKKFELKKLLEKKLNNMNPLARQRLIELADRKVATIAEAFAKAEKQETYPVNSLNDLFTLENESTEIIETTYSAEIDNGAKMTQIIKIANVLNAIDATRDTLINTELPPAYPKFVNFVDSKNKGVLMQKILPLQYLEMKEIKGLAEKIDRESGEKMNKYYMVSNKNESLNEQELIARGAPRVVSIINKEQYDNLKMNKEIDRTDLITSGYIDEDDQVPKKVVVQKKKLKKIEGKLNKTEASSTKKATIYHPADLFKNEIAFKFGQDDDFEKMLLDTDMTQSMQITEAIMNEVVYNSIEHSKGNYTALMVDIKKDSDGKSRITLNVEDNGSVAPSYKDNSGKIVDWNIAFEELCQVQKEDLLKTIQSKIKENFKEGKEGGIGMMYLVMLKKNYNFDIKYERGKDGKNRFTAVGTLQKTQE